MGAGRVEVGDIRGRLRGCRRGTAQLKPDFLRVNFRGTAFSSIFCRKKGKGDGGGSIGIEIDEGK